jgi:FixJ family two-component response regulator
MSPGSSRPPLIAIVEDDRAVLNSLEFSLQADGYAVCGFQRPADARDSTEIMQADCLVLDYGLPDLTGIDLLHVLRDRGLRCPAIVIASTPTARQWREAAEAGAPLLEKPLMGAMLTDRIRSALAAN